MGQLQQPPPVWAIGPLLLALPLSAVVYLLARRRLQEGQDSASRAHLFYRLISFSLLGQFLGHLHAPAIGAQAGWALWLIPVLLASGYFALDTVEAVARVWRTTPYIIDDLAPNGGQSSEDVALDRTSGQDLSVLVSSNVSSPSFANAVFAMQDVKIDVRKRRWILALLLTLFWIISFVDGLELISSSGGASGGEQQSLFIAFYYIHSLSLSLTAYAAMIHCRIQRIESARRRLTAWMLLTLCVVGVVGTSAIMALAGTIDAAGAQAVLLHPALIVFYGLAAGALLRVQQYFHAVKLASLDRWDTLAGVVVAFMVLSETMATSVFF